MTQTNQNYYVKCWRGMGLPSVTGKDGSRLAARSKPDTLMVMLTSLALRMSAQDTSTVMGVGSQVTGSESCKR